MIDGKEIRWFCEQCLEDQATNVWDHYDRATGRALCPSCKTKIAAAQGGQDDNRSNTDWDIDRDFLQGDADANTARVQE